MKKHLPTIYASIASIALIAVTYLGTYKEARALSVSSLLIQPFAGTIKSIDLCCNGVKVKIEKGQYQSPIEGTMIFQWQNLIPIPKLGWGLYSWWQLRPKAIVMGDATQGGVCITIASECESEDSVDYSIQQMGTTLKENNQTGGGAGGVTGGTSGVGGGSIGAGGGGSIGGGVGGI